MAFISKKKIEELKATEPLTVDDVREALGTGSLSSALKVEEGKLKAWAGEADGWVSVSDSELGSLGITESLGTKIMSGGTISSAGTISSVSASPLSSGVSIAAEDILTKSDKASGPTEGTISSVVVGGVVVGGKKYGLSGSGITAEDKIAMADKGRLDEIDELWSGTWKKSGKATAAGIRSITHLLAGEMVVRILGDLYDAIEQTDDASSITAVVRAAKAIEKKYGKYLNKGE